MTQTLTYPLLKYKGRAFKIPELKAVNSNGNGSRVIKFSEYVRAVLSLLSSFQAGDDVLEKPFDKFIVSHPFLNPNSDRFMP